MNRNFTAFCAAMLALAIMLVFYGGVWSNDRKYSFAETESTVKTVYLTFDDGPSDRVTPKILDVLAEEQVKATFFIIGLQAETRQYLIEREYIEGHTVAVHSYTHNYGKIYSSAESLIEDIDKCNDVIKRITGEYTNLYRFPGGSFGLSDKLISAVTAHGMRYVDWNASTRDAEILNATSNQIFNATISTAANADNIVILAHDSTTKSATASALKDIIKYYKERGYIFEAF